MTVPYFYFDTIKKTTAGILDLFNEIYIKNYSYNSSSEDYELQSSKVPISIATKSKIIENWQAYQTSSAPVRQYNLPRMALMLTTMSSDTLRQGNKYNIFKNNKFNFEDEKLIVKSLRNPSWNIITYTFSIITRKMREMTQIVEQIVPIFQPQMALNLKLIEEVNLNITLPATIEASINFDIQEDLDNSDLTFIEAEFEILVSVPLFPPIENFSLIKNISMNYGTIDDEDVHSETLETFKSFGNNNNTNSIMALGDDAVYTWISTRSQETDTISISTETTP